ncbi:MAG: sigma-54 dependent transcriptional regulator [Pseudomonadota bacterium]
MKPGLAKILIVDDEVYICNALSRLMKAEGFIALAAHDGETGLRMFREQRPDVMFLDFKMPGLSGMEVLMRAKELDPDIAVVMVTAYADIPGAVDAMRAGVHDYLAKPFDHHEVIRIAHRAVSERALKKRLKELSTDLEDSLSLIRLMGPSEAIGRLITQINRVAKSDFSVVILGETGSGKELVSQAIHNASRRSGGPFVAIDCGAIPETLLESELFGHEKGAFTGAVARSAGRFETAKGGTLFLDEVSNMPLGSQAKLLRVLQEKQVYRVGSSGPVDVDVRLLVATNQDLARGLRSRVFRQDLYYRLNEFTIRIPALRERKDDIPYLARRFLETTNLELGKEVMDFSHPALAALMSYDWPGNVRELRSTIRRAVLLAENEITVRELDIPKRIGPKVDSDTATDEFGWKGFSLKEIIKRNTQAVEREVFTRVLKQTGGNKAKAARMLNIDYKTIHTKVKKLGILLGGDNGEKEK